MKKNFLLIIVVIAGIVLLSCKGDPGPAGATGADGQPLYVKMFQDQVYPDTSYQGTYDSYIKKDEPDKNYGNCGILYCYNSSTITATDRVLLKFSKLDNYIPANSTIKDAYIVIFGYNLVTYTTSSISAYKITRNWTEGTGDCSGSSTTVVSWNNYSGISSWTNPGGDFDSTPISDAVKVNTFAAYHSLKINPDIVKQWIISPSTNYGVLIKTTDENKDYNIVLFSREFSFLGLILYRPRLVVYYTIP